MTLHPDGIGTQVSSLFVAGRTRNVCGGVPTLIVNVDQLPSSPSNVWLGAKLNGAGWLLFVAREYSQLLRRIAKTSINGTSHNCMRRAEQ